MTQDSAAGLDLLQNLGLIIASQVRPLRQLVEPLVTRVADIEQNLKEKADKQIYMQIKGIEQMLLEKASNSGMKQLSDRAMAFEQALKEKADCAKIYQQFQNIEQVLIEKASVNSVKDLSNQAMVLEQALNSKASVDIHMHIAQMKQALNAHVAEMEEARTSKAELDANIDARIAQTEQALCGKACVGDIHDLVERAQSCEQALKNKVDVVNMEKGLQEKVNVGDLQQLHAQLVTSHSTWQGSIEEKAGCLGVEMKQLEEAVEDLLKHNVSSIEQFQQLESTVSCMKQGLQQIDKVLPNTAKTGQVELIEAAVANVQAQIQQVEQAAKASFTDITNTFTSMESIVEEKVGLQQLQHFEGLLKGVQSRIERAEQTLSEEIGSGQLQQLEGTLLNFQMRATDIEQALQEKADVTKLGLVEGSLTCMEAQAKVLDHKLNNFSQSIHEEVHATKQKLSSLKALKDNVYAALAAQEQGPIKSLEDQLHAVVQKLQDKVSTHRLQQMEGVFSGLVAQLTNMEEIMREKVSIAQLQPQSLILEEMQTKMSGVQTNLADCSAAVREFAPQKSATVERLERLESIIGSELTALRQALKDKASSEELSYLRQLLEPPVTFTDEGYDAPISTRATLVETNLLARSRASKRKGGDP